MRAMTTSSSMSVNARTEGGGTFISKKQAGRGRERGPAALAASGRNIHGHDRQKIGMQNPRSSSTRREAAAQRHVQIDVNPVREMPGERRRRAGRVRRTQ